MVSAQVLFFDREDGSVVVDLILMVPTRDALGVRREAGAAYTLRLASGGVEDSLDLLGPLAHWAGSVEMVEVGISVQGPTSFLVIKGSDDMLLLEIDDGVAFPQPA